MAIYYDMGAHMKTTIEIADDLLVRAKREARRQRTTLRAVVEEALRQRLADRAPAGGFRLKRHPARGTGVVAPLAEGDWPAIRDLIYRTGPAGE